MLYPLLLLLLLTSLPLAAQSSSYRLWLDLAEKRNQLAGVHQEFEVESITTVAEGPRSAKRSITIDFSHDKWRERDSSGFGDYIRIFTGEERFYLEEDGEEFVRTRYKGKDPLPLPPPYQFKEFDTKKLTEQNRVDCPFPGPRKNCVIFVAPLKPWTKSNANNNITRQISGAGTWMFDLASGALLSSRITEVVQTPAYTYQHDNIQMIRKLKVGPVDAALFNPPAATLREVKELSSWDAPRMMKKLAGQPAPQFELHDLSGKPIRLADLKGQTVLLDFWTTWCPPCRRDGPTLDKLHARYGSSGLAIIGISVSEDRATVEKFLKTNPHPFPIVLTSENEMPRPYQVHVFPTYIVISPEGKVIAAEQGDLSMGEFRSMLKKAGLDLN